MGNLLDKPILDKTNQNGENDYVYYGVGSMQGYRTSMEDRHCVVDEIPNYPNVSFFGVFDGHGGDKAAEYCAANMLDIIIKVHHQYRLENGAESSNNHGSFITDEVIKRGFLKTDELFQIIADKNNLKDGTTAVTSFIRYDEEKEEYEIIVPNAGDSRCVLCRDGKAEPMSEDHKPRNQEEYRRIIAAGGNVFDNRVQGDLALSRALGDFSYKKNTKLSQEQQMVVATPDIRRTTIKINSTPDGEPQTDSFLILACDGIWDVMTSQQAVDFVREALREQRMLRANAINNSNSNDAKGTDGMIDINDTNNNNNNNNGNGNIGNNTGCDFDLSEIANRLIDYGVLTLGSKDNMSAIIVLFKDPKRRGKRSSSSSSSSCNICSSSGTNDNNDNNSTPMMMMMATTSPSSSSSSSSF